MIPKKIHYCWFGRGEKPKLAQKCITSWKKYCPDYEIIQWDEDNFDMDTNGNTRWCYDNKKWAFLSDFARLAVVAEHGGVYFDTDVELIKPPDELLEYEAFYGFEDDSNIASGLGFGAEAGHPTILTMERAYLALEADEDGNYPIVRCPELNTGALLPFGLKLDGSRQNVAGAEILPAEFLNPYEDATGRMRKTSNTISIHWYAKSWHSKIIILRSRLTRPFHRIFGINCFQWLKKREES